MVEVFKTNVTQLRQARKLVRLVQKTFSGYKANFDLQDVDRILRIESPGWVEEKKVIELLDTAGFTAEVLPDIPVLPITTHVHALSDCKWHRAI
jgi:hypothetical protein